MQLPDSGAEVGRRRRKLLVTSLSPETGAPLRPITGSRAPRAMRPAANYNRILDEESPMSHSDLSSILSQLAAVSSDQVSSPTTPVPVFCSQGELMRVAALRDHDRLVAAGLAPTILDAFGTQLSALATADAEWQIFRLQGRPQAQLELEDSAFELRNEAIAAVQWGLRAVPDAVGRLSHIREGQGLVDTLADLEELAVLLRTYGDRMAIPGFDAAAEAAKCEQKAAEVRTGAAQWKLDQSQAELLDRRNRAFTLAAQTAATIRSAAQYAFRDQDERRTAPYRDLYAADKRRRYRQRPGEPAPEAPVPAPTPVSTPSPSPVPPPA
jgi:hypothetical protein